MKKIPVKKNNIIFNNNNNNNNNNEQDLQVYDLFNEKIPVKKNINNINIITGEKIQLLADIFIGTPQLLNNNPNITVNHSNAIDINNINSKFNNPKYVYIYPDIYNIFKEKLDFFNNCFTLITHNSDYSICDNEICNYIANHEKVIRWFGQNVLFNHPKIEIIPIGFANTQWKHGNPKIITNTIKNLDNIKKTNDVYFYFSIDTNFNKRNDCYQKLKNYIKISDKKPEEEFFNYLATFNFSICPEGNGADTHRLWESYYFKIIPIVLDTPFIRIIKEKYKLPMIILKDWTDLVGMKLKYQDYDNSILDFNILKNEILNYNNNKMTIIYSFIGTLPKYTIESIYQARLFFKGNIYLITNDLYSKYLEKLINDYNVIVIDYKDVVDNRFIDIYNKYKHFWYGYDYIEGLIGRELLLIYSYERLFIVNNLIKKLKLKDVLTLEIDNLIYSNPETLLNKFRAAGDYTGLITSENNYGIGYMYIKDNVDLLLDFMIEFITDVNYRTTYGGISEMKALHAFHAKYNKLILLPQFFNRPDMHIENYINIDKFNNTIFDGNGHGIKLFGRDSFHKTPFSQLFINELDDTITYKWGKNKDGLLIPYLLDTINNRWLLINNLHIHSKDLYKGLSKPLE